MTNFDKWKSELTMADIAEIFKAMMTPDHIIGYGCKRCPFDCDCEEHWGTNACCQKVKRWARAEAEEATK